MLIIKMTIPADRVEKVRKLGTESDAMQKVIQQMITDNSTNPDVLSSVAFKKYHEMYTETHTAFELEKEGIERDFVPSAVKNERTEWRLDYITAVLTVTHSSDMFNNNLPDISDIDPSASGIEMQWK